MTNLIISKLDYKRLQEHAVKAKTDPNSSFTQVRTLLQCVNRATLLEPTEIPADVVTMNSKVKIVYLENSKTLDLSLVYPEQANVQQKCISIFSPLATALLGCKQGDLVTFTIPDRTVKIKIDRILYQPESAGDFTL